ncbi:MAG: AraC family transcriptional regulator [SAR324 cluster bacterium]|nr:AraC family transcriptional regulator [SAR324 cluster bacterium]
MSNLPHSERMNRVIKYIEDYIDENLDIQRLSKVACYSEFHFSRLFRSFTGESIYGFKKRLLLERSIKHLLYSDENMTEISFKCGYDNQSSFNKAFKKQFTYTPSEVRKQMILPVLNQKKTSKMRSNKMKPEILELKSKEIIYAREVGDYSTAAEKAWGRIMKFGYSNRLMSKEVESIGISHDSPEVTEVQHLRYDACLTLNTEISSEDNLQKGAIAGGTYGVFLHIGAYEKFQESYNFIFNEWLPKSQYTLRDAPPFELYLNRDPRRTKPENLRTKIFIPLN